MAETAGSVLTDAYGLLVVAGAESPIESVDAKLAMRTMNRFMDQLALEGAPLGWTVVSNVADPITIPLGTMTGLIANTAIELAPYFGVTVGAELATMARDGRKAMFIAGFSIGPSQYPSGLPIGSGNEGDTFNNTHFYPDAQSTILSESTGPIVLEDET